MQQQQQQQQQQQRSAWPERPDRRGGRQEACGLRCRRPGGAGGGCGGFSSPGRGRGRAGEGAGDSLPAESGERQGKSGLPFQIRAEDLIWGSQVI